MPSPDEYPAAPTPAGGKLPAVTKHGHPVTFSRGTMPQNPLMPSMFEILSYRESGPEYQRRNNGRETINPTPETLAEYAEFKKHWDIVEASQFTEWNFEGGLELNKPAPREKINYTETFAEWVARCRQLDAEK